MTTEPAPSTPAIEAVRVAGIAHTVTRHGRVSSLEEAAAARGIAPRDLIKTLVVRVSEGEHVFVLVPGDRTFSWAKVRSLLGTNRISMPDASEARAVTGYERGTITPFGSTTRLPVIADTHLRGRTISLGGGAHGVGLTLSGDDVIAHFGATVADISDEETRPTGGSAPRVPPEDPPGSNSQSSAHFPPSSSAGSGRLDVRTPSSGSGHHAHAQPGRRCRSPRRRAG